MKKMLERMHRLEHLYLLARLYLQKLDKDRCFWTNMTDYSRKS